MDSSDWVINYHINIYLTHNQCTNKMFTGIAYINYSNTTLYVIFFYIKFAFTPLLIKEISVHQKSLGPTLRHSTNIFK